MLVLEILWYIIPAIFMGFIGWMTVSTFFNTREIKERMEVDEMNRAQRRAEARQNKQNPRHGNVNLQVIVKQLNDSLRALDKAGIRIHDWDDPDIALWGFQIKHGTIHYVSVKENKETE